MPARFPFRSLRSTRRSFEFHRPRSTRVLYESTGGIIAREEERVSVVRRKTFDNSCKRCKRWLHFATKGRRKNRLERNRNERLTIRKNSNEVEGKRVEMGNVSISIERWRDEYRGERGRSGIHGIGRHVKFIYRVTASSNDPHFRPRPASASIATIPAVARISPKTGRPKRALRPLSRATNFPPSINFRFFHGYPNIRTYTRFYRTRSYAAIYPNILHFFLQITLLEIEGKAHVNTGRAFKMEKIRAEALGSRSTRKIEKRTCY